MFSAIVPVKNEETRVSRLLLRLVNITDIRHIFVILNGSNDHTRTEVETIRRRYTNKFTLVLFKEPLGIDVPRAVGARLAFSYGSEYALFIDGDLVGEITIELKNFIETTISRCFDLSLINCYPQGPPTGTQSETMFYFRRLLNSELGLEDSIGLSTPSHGPHVVSRRLLSLVPWRDFAVPPTLLVYAQKDRLRIGTAAVIPHTRLGSSIKNQTHSTLIIDTIIGDCLEALNLAKHLPRNRVCDHKEYLGYHVQRRFDLLQSFLAGRLMN